MNWLAMFSGLAAASNLRIHRISEARANLAQYGGKTATTSQGYTGTIKHASGNQLCVVIIPRGDRRAPGGFCIWEPVEKLTIKGAK